MYDKSNSKGKRKREGHVNLWTRYGKQPTTTSNNCTQIRKGVTPIRPTINETKFQNVNNIRKWCGGCPSKLGGIVGQCSKLLLASRLFLMRVLLNRFGNLKVTFYLFNWSATRNDMAKSDGDWLSCILHHIYMPEGLHLNFKRSALNSCGVSVNQPSMS